MLNIRGKIISHESQFTGLTNSEKAHARTYLRCHASEIRTFALAKVDHVVFFSAEGVIFKLPLNDTLYNAIMSHPAYPRVKYECWISDSKITLSRQIV